MADRCRSRILPPGYVQPVRCKGDAGHPVERIHPGDLIDGGFKQARCHWNDWRHHLWTDSAPDLLPE